MLVVSNTSPVLNLALIGKLHLIKSQFSEITLPESVIAELNLHKDIPGNEDIRIAIKQHWIRIHKLTNLAVSSILKTYLDEGESDAIALALELKADIILLDEKDARSYARNLGLPMTGVIGILVKGYFDGEIKSIRRSMEDLETKAGFRIGKKLYNQIFNLEN